MSGEDFFTIGLLGGGALLWCLGCGWLAIGTILKRINSIGAYEPTPHERITEAMNEKRL